MIENSITLIIWLSLGAGLIIGIICGAFVAVMLIPNGINDAWHEGYTAAVEDAKEAATPEAPAISRK